MLGIKIYLAFCLAGIIHKSGCSFLIAFQDLKEPSYLQPRIFLLSA